MSSRRGLRQDVMIDLGLVEMAGNRMTGRQARFRFSPSLPGHFDRYSVRTHGQSPSSLSGFPTFLESLPEILAFIGDDRLFAHGVASDMTVLNAELLRAGIADLPRERFFDTVPLVKKAFPGSPPGLDSVASRLFGEPERGFHGALSDAVLLARVLEKVCPVTDRDLQRVISGVQKIHAPEKERDGLTL